MRSPLRAVSTAILATFLVSFSQSVAEAGRTVVHRGRGGRTTVVHKGPRRTVVVHKGFPLARTWPTVVIRTPIRPVRVLTPRLYLAPVFFAPLIVATAPKNISWEDTEVIEKREEWVETTLNADARGSRLFLNIEGLAQLSFAEVVFDNGESQVVDFVDKDVKEGRYLLLDFKNGRKVDHVRVVGRARTDEAGLTLLLEK
ncbi:MAG: hypothetical protein SGI90_05240 [Candidatus Eisenbacteria bacterium]|nr:hypothetical protein [Candidatus Eisenbacteria bacterium]